MKDTASGRRRFVERLNRRAVEEGLERAGGSRTGERGGRASQSSRARLVGRQPSLCRALAGGGRGGSEEAAPPQRAGGSSDQGQW